MDGPRLPPQCLQAIEGQQSPSGLNAIEPLPNFWVVQKILCNHGQLAMPNSRETGGLGRNHSLSFDQRRRPETLGTAMATAFFCPTSTTSRLPRVTPV